MSGWRLWRSVEALSLADEYPQLVGELQLAIMAIMDDPKAGVPLQGHLAGKWAFAVHDLVITYDLLENVPPLVAERYVRILAISPLASNG